MIEEKEAFFNEGYLALLAALPEASKAVFGKMNVHQMVEHMAHSFQIASGKVYFENKQSEELTAKMYRFMMSDKPFRDNTPNPNLADIPLSPRFSTIKESIADLKLEISHFFEVFNEPDKRVGSPFFGNLNRNEQLHLLYKHAMHHLRQFDAMPT